MKMVGMLKWVLRMNKAVGGMVVVEDKQKWLLPVV